MTVVWCCRWLCLLLQLDWWTRQDDGFCSWYLQGAWLSAASSWGSPSTYGSGFLRFFPVVRTLHPFHCSMFTTCSQVLMCSETWCGPLLLQALPAEKMSDAWNTFIGELALISLLVSAHRFAIECLLSWICLFILVHRWVVFSAGLHRSIFTGNGCYSMDHHVRGELSLLFRFMSSLDCVGIFFGLTFVMVGFTDLPCAC